MHNALKEEKATCKVALRITKALELKRSKSTTRFAKKETTVENRIACSEELERRKEMNTYSWKCLKLISYILES
jgi:hypothetical protein